MKYQATKFLLGISIFALFLFVGCKPTNPNWKRDIASPQPLGNALESVTSVIMHDVFNPPQASRIYGYATVASYEAAIANSAEYISLAGQLKGFTATPKPSGEVANEVASVVAFMETAKGLVFSPKMLETELQKILKNYEAKGIPSDIQARSVEYGKQVSAHVLAWMKKDNYKQTRSMPKYTISEETGRWIPTPPAYKDGIEPNWMKVRPFVIDTSAQFVPARPPAYLPEAKELYETSKKLTDEQKAIANFWDDNGFALQLQGHAMFSVKKITPGGHWMNIARLVSNKANANFVTTAEALMRTAIGIADAFIVCWDEKYRSNRIRPETAINQTIDLDWQPLLQTPPFPEYPSGHSTITAAAASALTKVYGDNFAFTDSTEVRFGFGTRSFKSFFEAAEEAAISRFYGGIHFRSGNEIGKAMGKQVGAWHSEKLKTRK